MATNSPRAVVLMSIYPKYAQSILDGRKTVEFRKSGLAKESTHVVIYATAPVKRIVGFFEIEGIHEGRPEDLWRRFGNRGDVSEDFFWAYFGERDRGFAIQVRRAIALKKPAPLDSLQPDLSAPQSYRYLAQQSLSDLATSVA